jgi:hypothetical protein
MFAREEVIPYAILLLDCLFSNLSKTDVKIAILDVQSEIENYPDKEYVLAWLYRLSIHYLPGDTNKIFKRFKNFPLIGMGIDTTHKSMPYFDKISVDQLNTTDAKKLSKITLINKIMLDNLRGKKIGKIRVFNKY